jgi:prophage maintenance system killer protein
MANEIEIYTTEEGIKLEIKFDGDTVWATQRQIAELFKTTPQNITLHLKKIYSEEEVDAISTCKEYLQVQKEGKRLVERKQLFYNLDAILSVGYRVNSKRGTQFRQWATQRLKDYLVKGYAINEKRLKETEQRFAELKQAVGLLEKVAKNKQLSGSETQGLLKVLSDFSAALDILDRYDHQQLKIGKTKTKESFRISYKQATKAIKSLKEKFGGSALFGKEKDESFKSSLSAIYQTFDGKDVYNSVEEKAAHLLYFVVKNHSFTDGNKRIAAFLFVWFLERNNLLYFENKKVIDDNALVALTLMIAESNPDDKRMMIKVIVNLIKNKK